MRATTPDRFSLSRALNGVSVEPGGKIEVLFIELLIVLLTRAIIGSGFDILSEPCMAVVLGVLVSFRAIDLRTAGIMDTVLGVAAGIGVEVSAGTDVDIWAAKTTVVAPPEDVFLFGCEVWCC